MQNLRVGQAQATLIRPWEQPATRALRVGLSGGIGSGKSTVAQVLKAQGALLADADRIAREIVFPGSEALAAITEAFGEGILNEDSSLNRAALAQQVFRCSSARRTLENITHPLIAARAEEILSTAPHDGCAVYDVPLLVEKQMQHLFDVVLIVDAPENIRIARLIKRSMTMHEAKQRIKTQASRQERQSVAHIWIDNNGSKTELELLVEQVKKQWLQPQK
ncbi:MULTISPECIES: dephospho-CoA kinase [unclassified Schaalia]|uniref:dephospho-CoA kinase n=1 Tax=unclassified Schaalia TaxID=2691889 RepID=UPI001E5899DB|nr:MULTISPECIES: dephospho-CoA kinase [unclassified Schaalia]MCD4550156.1 dephospho-CoA kinase [Schaalia sp. lx-260]MCD4557424.1 dephospho-CoA kinase [Schaalia sp. lx-100]